MKRIILSLTLISIAWSTSCQSTDVIKLYVLYDVSGSVSINDIYHNFQELNRQLLREDNQTSRSPFSIELIPFAENIDSQSVDVYSKESVDKSRKDLIKYFERVSQHENDELGKKYTNLLKALKTVFKKSKQDTASFGVFIFTDGQLEQGDIKEKFNIGQYRDSIKTYVDGFRTGRRPVFLIQSSPKRENKYFPSINNPSIVRTDSLCVSKDFFWLRSGVPYGKEKYSSVKRAFEDFLIQAFLQIQKSDEEDPKNIITRFLFISDLIYYSDLYDDFKKIKRSKDLKHSFNEARFNQFLKTIEVSSTTYKKNKEHRMKVFTSDEYKKVLPVLQKKSDQKMNRIGGKQSLSSFNDEKLKLFLNTAPTPLPTSFDALLNEIKLALRSSNSLSKEDLANLYPKILQLIEFDDFKKTKQDFTDFKRDNIIELSDIRNEVSSSESKKNNTADFELGNRQVEPLQTLTQSDTKQKNFQEAVILGLADYLIKRSKEEALFLTLEIMNKNIFEPSTFLRDTLFHHTAKILSTLNPSVNSTFEPNLVLIKEAFNQDMDLISSSLIKHPKARKSNGLVSLIYSAELINNLVKGKTLEDSFDNLLRKLPVDSISSSPAERSFLFTCHLISFLKNHDLSSLYQNNSTENLDVFSKIVAIYIAQKYLDIHGIRDINSIAEKIQKIYEEYELVKRQIEMYNRETNSLKPTGSFAEYKEYKRQLSMQILKSCSDLLLSGVELAGNFTNEEYGEAKESIYSLKVECTTAIECWFLIKDKKYAEAASHLIPMIPKLPIVKIDDSKSFKRKFGHLRSAINILALQRDKESLEKVLKTALADSVYTSMELKDALDFLKRNQLLFLQPLLLHTRDSLVFDEDILDANSLALPKFKLGRLNQDTTTNNHIIRLKNLLREPNLTLPENKFLTETRFNTLFDTLRIWEVRLPDGLSTNQVLKLYDDAITTFTDNTFKVENLVSKIKKKMLEETFTDSAKVHIVKQLLSYFSIDGLDDNLKKLLAIAGEVSTAQNAGDVEKVIEKYALPVASYRIKREAVSSWMINAYVGGSSVWFQDKSSFGYAISAPVGIEHSWRFKNRSGSFSFFGSVLDVGNVINYRLNDSVASDKTFLLENVVSPGLFGVLGLSKRFPFSVGLGYQFNPQRASLFLAFDLPLFRLN